MHPEVLRAAPVIGPRVTLRVTCRLASFMGNSLRRNGKTLQYKVRGFLVRGFKERLLRFE